MMQLPFYQNIQEVKAAASECRACDRCEQRTQVVFGAGNPNADLMLVAEYPSQSDDRTRVPFSGPAGDFLDEILEEVGINREQIWITNLVRCYATHTGRPGDKIRGAGKRERDACRTWLDLEMQWVDPKVILAVGAPAASAIIKSDFRLTDERGTWHRRPADGRMAIATLQPAYLLRLRPHDPERFAPLRELLIADIRSAAAGAGLVEPSDYPTSGG